MVMATDLLPGGGVAGRHRSWDWSSLRGRSVTGHDFRQHEGRACFYQAIVVGPGSVPTPCPSRQIAARAPPERTGGPDSSRVIPTQEVRHQPCQPAPGQPPRTLTDSSIPAGTPPPVASPAPATPPPTHADSSIPAGTPPPTHADNSVSADVDVLSNLAGIPGGGHIDALRDLRPAARRDAQLAYELLFHPADDGPLPLVDRLAIAVFVAGLHRHDAAIAHYRDALREAGAASELRAAVYRETEAAAVPGPAGRYRESGLTAESVPVAEFRVRPESLAVLGERLSAGLEHARLLVLHPRDSRPERLEALTAAGWDEDGIVTLSQLVAYLSYQIRAAVGLAALAATLEDS